MSTPYHFAGNTRAIILPAVANLAAPTIAEINAGTDISSDLLIQGLNVTRSTETFDNTPWHSDLQTIRHGHYSITSAALTGRRSRQGTTDGLWSLALFGTRHFLIVRSGIKLTTAWAAGQLVDAFDFRFGKRSIVASGQAGVTFDAPLTITADNDAAVVAA